MCVWSLNSSDHGFTKTRRPGHLQCTPTFRPLLLALPLSLLELQLSCPFSLCFHLSQSYVSCTPYSPREVVQVCCTSDRLGFLYPCCLCPWLCPCLSSCPFTWSQSVLHRHPRAKKSAASARRGSTTSALICAKEFSHAESFITCFCTSARAANPFSNTPRFTVFHSPTAL